MAVADAEMTEINRQIDRIVESKPELSDALAFYRASIPVLRTAQAAVPPFQLPADRVSQKLLAGIPLLTGEDLPLDPDATREVFLQLVAIAETGTQPEQPSLFNRLFVRGKPDMAALMERAQSGDTAALRSVAAGQIRQAVARDKLDLIPLWSAVAQGDVRVIELTAQGLSLDAAVLRMLVQHSLKPALRAWTASLAADADLNLWQRGLCPMCGSVPSLSEIQGKDGERRLRCGMCGCDWGYKRLQCVFCANTDYEALNRLFVEGEGDKYFLQTCDVCRGYIKIINTFAPTPVDLLPVEDSATLHLDLIAQEREYMRVAVR